MLKQIVIDALNAQVATESFASANYLAMASWCDREGLEGCANFLYRQSDEERVHMLKIFHYINEMDGHALSPAVPQAAIEYPSVRNLFENVLAHEQKVTASINNLVNLCYEEKDHATQSFLQWYVDEQREEEALMRHILDKIRLIGDTPGAGYWIDLEMEKINAAEAKAAAAPKK
jgi:ferritin